MGDKNSLDEFVKKNLSKLINIAVYYTKDVDDAKDLVQTACLNVFEHKYTEFSTGLFRTIIYNEFVNGYRKRKIDALHEKNHIKINSSFQDDIDNKELIQVIQSKGNELSYFVKGYKYEEISKIFN